MNEFFLQCEREMRELTNLETTLQGPDGVCSPQTMRELELTLKTVENIISLLHKVSTEFLNIFDLSSFTTLVVENQRSEMTVLIILDQPVFGTSCICTSQKIMADFSTTN